MGVDFNCKLIKHPFFIEELLHDTIRVLKMNTLSKHFFVILALGLILLALPAQNILAADPSIPPGQEIGYSPP